MVTRECIAIIPARGNSKRIPRKNIVEFFGRPLIGWTIEAALATGTFNRVLVSTDDEEIATVAQGFSAEVPFLRDKAADDNTPVSEAIIAALDQASSYWDENYRVVVQLMPNCPLRGSKEIREALTHFRGHLSEFQISCFKFGWMNPWWAATLDANGCPRRVFEDFATVRSQDLTTLYCPSGAIWIARVDALRRAQTFYGPEHVYYPMHWACALDIDDNEDLEMAKAAKIMLENV